MFFRLCKYGLLRTIRKKEALFWCLMFPIILGSLFKVTLGNFSDTKLTFHQIPVAYVQGEGAQEEFALLLDTLEQSEKLVKVVKTDEQKAEKLLRDKEVEGIYLNGTKINLIVTEEDISQSILKSVLEQYERTSSTFSNIAERNPAAIEKAVQTLSENQNYVTETNVTEDKMDYMVNFFYSLLAMSCLYGSFMGLRTAIEFKADLSPLAARRCVASSNRFMLLMSDVVSKIITQFLSGVIALCYLMFVLKIQMGSQIEYMILILLAGSTVGVSMGVLIGTLGKMQESVKNGICVSVSMVLSFLSGLMVDKMYQIVEASAPIINRINPASLIVNAFYSLNIYDNYTRYLQCILSLFAVAALLWICTFALIRRERYASI